MTCVHAHSHININASGFTNSPGKQFSLQSITSTAQSQTEHTVCTIIMIMVYRTCHKDTHRQKILSKCYDNDMVYVPDSIYHIETHLHTRYSMILILLFLQTTHTIIAITKNLDTSTRILLETDNHRNQ